jgi:hypothetical protein
VSVLLEELETRSGVDRSELPADDERLLKGLLDILRAIEDVKAGRL